MPKCTVNGCGSFMVRADLFDPEGTVPLAGMVEQDGYPWVCLTHGTRASAPNLNTVET